MARPNSVIKAPSDARCLETPDQSVIICFDCLDHIPYPGSKQESSTPVWSSTCIVIKIHFL